MSLFQPSEKLLPTVAPQQMTAREWILDLIAEYAQSSHLGRIASGVDMDDTADEIGLDVLDVVEIIVRCETHFRTTLSEDWTVEPDLTQLRICDIVAAVEDVLPRGNRS